MCRARNNQQYGEGSNAHVRTLDFPTVADTFLTPLAGRVTPECKNLRPPCRKDWLWLAKRALLSWSRRSSRGERLKGKEALPTPLPRGEWRGRGGGGGGRPEPQRGGSWRSRTPVSSTTPSSSSSRRPRSARTALRSCLRA